MCEGVALSSSMGRLLMRLGVVLARVAPDRLKGGGKIHPGRLEPIKLYPFFGVATGAYRRHRTTIFVGDCGCACV